RKSLEKRRKDEDVGQVEHRNLVGFGQVPGEDYRSLEPETAAERLQLAPQRTRPNPDQPDILACRATNLREGLDQQHRILPGDEWTQGEQHPLAGDVPAAGQDFV